MRTKWMRIIRIDIQPHSHGPLWVNAFVNCNFCVQKEWFYVLCPWHCSRAHGNYDFIINNKFYVLRNIWLAGLKKDSMFTTPRNNSSFRNVRVELLYLLKNKASTYIFELNIFIFPSSYDKVQWHECLGVDCSCVAAKFMQLLGVCVNFVGRSCMRLNYFKNYVRANTEVEKCINTCTDYPQNNTTSYTCLNSITERKLA